MADIKTITLPDNSTYNLRDSNCVIATGTSVGLVRPDGTTITVDANGTISSTGGESAEALTDQEVEDAVDAAFITETYAITNNAGCRSITNDGTYGSGNTTIIDSASVGDTITFATHNTITPAVTEESGDTITVDSVSSYSVIDGPMTDVYIVRSFIMPNADVTISVA